VLYDIGVKERPLARVAARVGWGADVDEIFRLMDSGVKCASGEVILDVPIGGGPALRAAPGRMQGTLIGVDLSEQMLQRAAAVMRAEGLSRVLLARGDAMRLPVIDSSVDRVLCFNGLHVMTDKEQVLSEFHRVLKPGGEVWGSVVVRDPDARLRRPWVELGWWFFHPADEYELELTARDAGFVGWAQQRTGNLMVFKGRR
jgi:ubiquinone/menaquinone biosynthesis C-methylase UbiE